jgi:thiol-disulfide isomerase/thioredoxin
MRFLVSILLVCLATPLPASVISEIRDKLSAGDSASADAIADEFCRTSGPNADCANAVAWLARGALMMGHREQARLYLERAKKMTDDLAGKVRPEDDYDLAIALGTEIEVEAKLLADEGATDKAIALLKTELNHWKLWDIQARIQKDLNILTLEGKPAPLLEPGTSGKVVLLFLWGHWCSDCTDQEPVIARIHQRYAPKGLMVVAPTRRRGDVNGKEATPAEEDAEIERVWKQSYAGLAGVPHPVDRAAMLAYGVSSTPTLVLIDRAGIVRLYCPFRLSEAVLARHIDAMLQSAEAPTPLGDVRRRP